PPTSEVASVQQTTRQQRKAPLLANSDRQLLPGIPADDTPRPPLEATDVTAPCAHLKRTGAPRVLPAQTTLPAPNSARSEQTTAYGVNTHENGSRRGSLRGSNGCG